MTTEKNLGELERAKQSSECWKDLDREETYASSYGCNAVVDLAYIDDNKKELRRVGAKEVVMACKDNGYKTAALKMLWKGSISFDLLN